MVRHVTCVSEFDAVLKEAGNNLVVVDFTAEWCGPCKLMAPFFEEMAGKPEYKNVIFLKVDVDDADDVSAKCGIKCMPTFQFFRNGEMIEEFSGANKAKLAELLANHAAK